MCIGSLLTGCVVRQRAPLPPPAAGGIAIPAPAREPPENEARVFVEATPAAKVLHAREGRPVLAAPRLLCPSTPCSFLLPYGDHTLTLEGHRPFRAIAASESSNVTVHVHDPFVAVRVNLSRDEPSTGVFVGVGVAGAGAVTSFVGVLGAGTDRSSTAYDVIAVAGLAPLVVGLVIAATSTTVHQEGGATQWDPRTIARAAANGLAF